MSWDLVVGVCTVIGGVSASLAIYQFFSEHTPMVYTGTKRPRHRIHLWFRRSSANTQDYLQFSQEIDDLMQSRNELSALPPVSGSAKSQEQPQREKKENFGKLLVYTNRAQFGKEVHICEYRRWALRTIRPSESTVVRCFQHHVNKHRLFVALLEVPAGSYIVWIGQARPVAFFKRPTAVLIFSGKLTELFLR